MTRRLTLIALAMLFALPVLALGSAWVGWADPATRAVLWHLTQTVLPDYTLTSLTLCVLVAVGVLTVGLSSAVCVSLTDFAGRRWLEWGLLLPLAMPAYVVAYAYTDLLQYSGALQTALRNATGQGGRWFPEVRNLWGAAWVFTFTLYPYVYLLARTALREAAPSLLEAARMLGLDWRERVWRVALPLARPAVAAGTALALMETLADYGVSSYFGLQTYTAGIYKAWLALDDRLAAAQLATALLALVSVLLWVERLARARQRYAVGRPGASGTAGDARKLTGRAAALAWLVCAIPIVMGFVLPVLALLHPLYQTWPDLIWSSYLAWVGHSLRLGAVGAALAVVLAAGLAFARRDAPTLLARTAAQWASLGYALPGAVVVVGLLLPLGWLQAAAPGLQAGYWMLSLPLALIWAYLIRFTPVALQTLDSAYARISPNQDAAARLLGASRWALWWRVHGPQLRPSLGVAALLVFVDVMKELPATLVLRPFDSDTLAVMTFQLARDERLGEAALPALTLVAVGLVPVLLLMRTLQPAGRALKSPP